MTAGDLDESGEVIRSYFSALYKGVERFNRRVYSETDVQPRCSDGLKSLVSTTPAEAVRNGLFMEKEAIRHAVCEIERRVDAVVKIGALREEAHSGCVEDNLRQWVTERIALEHPELVAACAEREREHREKINQARLDAQEVARDGHGGEELSAGKGMGR